MVPRLCRYKWHSNGLKAHILAEVFYYLCSKCEVCHPGHTMLSTVVIWVKKRRVAAAQNCYHRPPFLSHCLSLRAWFTQTTCGRLRTCALARQKQRPPIGCCRPTETLHNSATQFELGSCCIHAPRNFEVFRQFASLTLHYITTFWISSFSMSIFEKSCK